ncbi:ABC transporter substrate-binding protein [Thermophilibacter provencensis]|uniref:ABC transporter substrate-binding protein n=1 Tax=Thermophilibacter provencensis TaxID=1852386 RepID=A0ABT7V3T5_9ACTN|nr:ABC transporter substrate-binding protein [Thermophilibacter provencensis]MDM8271262.1 ABC transporter substrate-binding protein [Thermophilibacter provencensis]HJA28702.1 ABC transporter substrate-binding protein [Candidatus Olsenella pullicola]
MKLSSRIAGGLAVACALAVTIAGCSGGGQTSTPASDNTSEASYTLVTDGTITVASDLANAPLDFVDENTGEAQGFEIDLINAVADKLGLECEVLPAMKFDTIVPLIEQGGKADVGVSNITITDARMEQVDFTDSYMDSNQGLVTLAANADVTEDDLNVEGTKIAVQAGTTGASWAEENLPNAEIVALDDPVVAITGVQTGLYSAAVADLPVMTYLCSSSFTDCQVAIEIPTGEQYGIAVNKDNPGLTEAINGALAELEEEGYISELEVKWLGAEL